MKYEHPLSPYGGNSASNLHPGEGWAVGGAQQSWDHFYVIKQRMFSSNHIILVSLLFTSSIYLDLKVISYKEKIYPEKNAQLNKIWISQ